MTWSFPPEGTGGRGGGCEDPLVLSRAAGPWEGSFGVRLKRSFSPRRSSRTGAGEG